MKLPDISDHPLYRIEPETLCEKLLGLKIDYRNLSTDGSILGLTSFETVGIELPGSDGTADFYVLDGKTVLIESRLRENKQQNGRRNFTIAHEASHQILKMVFPEDYGGYSCEQAIHFCRESSKQKGVITDWEEWQSNTLAASILLPKFLIERAMKRFHVNDKIPILNRIFANRSYEKFAAMADLLGCSQTALAIRMEQFGWIGENHLQDPYRLIDMEGS
jgi:Zn-dependent peptidase ImmA (M78 family)